jgi:ABC-type protease/lipase transport system fused ATPase/permease subunit
VLLGVWPVLGGKVRLDGADIHAWNKLELGPYVGYLPQDVELFEGSLAENIARFGDVDEQQLVDAMKLAGLEELVASWPDGAETQIGVDGAFLSGGQRQRVGLARAVYGSPRFIVLDEPNSSLDEKGDAVLLEMLFELKRRDATVLVVTHRKTILPAVDKLLVMRDGRVQVFGEKNQVLAALQPQATPAGNPA